MSDREPHHWAQTKISDPTLENRSNVFFAAVEMTRMPMILADPRLPDCPTARLPLQIMPFLTSPDMRSVKWSEETVVFYKALVPTQMMSGN